MTNDLLIRDLLLTLYAWNLRHNVRARKQMIRLMVPVSLRPPEEVTMPAANVVSMVAITRVPIGLMIPRACSPVSLAR